MRTTLSAFLLVSVIAAAQAFAADTPPSVESIRRLMVATEAKKSVDGALGQMDGAMENAAKAALAGRPVDEKTQVVLDEMRVKLTALLKETLAWQDLEPLMIDVYQRSLSQKEVNGMLKFYESDAGKAVVRKFPLIQQNTMQLMQGRIKDMMPKMMQIQQDAIATLKAGPAPATPPAPAPAATE